ncbi:Phosphate acetyltransferase [Defluviimonas aquaemixtae]|uniref:Phosphate acetyltransferase n=1 Tax=Albidovulum aquaemixtae TaxID=1542388 RepID=A0A2R8B632_9RHOB|nr:phosphate acyltransferase [Defluviimonas aquaemixtae]SPH18016.1 Phosphate acetyltransferase [Defluviimonas aquaemixtae]
MHRDTRAAGATRTKVEQRDPFPFLSPIEPHCPERLLAQARSCKRPRVALVNAGAIHPLQGIREAADHGLAEPILIGDRVKIAATAEEIGWDIGGLRLIHAPRETAATEAARLAREGEADAVMKGQIHSTTFLKALLPSAAGLRDKEARCGHVFHITAPTSDRPLLVTDAALNVDPDMRTRQACLTQAVRLAEILGVTRPKAGLLAPSEDVSPSIPNTEEAAEIARWAKDALPEAVVQGPMALDLIFSRASAEVKGYVSDVSGDADIMLVPNITSGNALFKLMVLGMGACAGGVVMGARVPILLTSRSQAAPARIASAALGAIVAGAA